MNLTEAPTPLTARERALYWSVAVLCAASRFLAMSRSIWEWDETLFCLGMRSYDITSHHPHPPGFPVYIAAAKLVRLVVGSDFRSLQALNLLAGVLLFPAMFMLARELRLRFSTGVAAGVLMLFFPNVWFFGGTAFSDVVSITLVVFAVAFLFRGCRDENAYFIGAFLLALSAGIRPQNLLVGLFPALLATAYRARVAVRDVIFAALLGAAVVTVAYAGAIHATGSLDQYLSAVRAHADYIARIDSFRSPTRPPLWHLFDRFFIKQYQNSVLGVITSIFVLISLIGAVRQRDRSILYILLTFGPFAISAWLMLDRFSVNRFSIGYAPLFAILAADGMARVGRRVDLEVALDAALVASFLIWTWPALAPVRNEVAPSAEGVAAVSQHIDYRRDDLFVAFAMTPFMQYLLPDAPYVRVLDERAVPLSIGNKRPYLLAEIDRTQPRGWVFHRDRKRLWNITRRHYFDVALEPVTAQAQFLGGWYGPERSGTDEFRWMSGRSVTLLPPSTGNSVLRMHFDIPEEMVPLHTTVTIIFNGKTLERMQPAQGHVERDYDDLQPAAGANRLEIIVDHTMNQARQHTGEDARELGLRLRFLAWGPS